MLRILVAPVLALVFFACALLAPPRPYRLAFLAATLMEGAVSVYRGIVWVLPSLFSGF